MDFKTVTATPQKPMTQSICAHGFNYCYCNYIQVQGLLSVFYKDAITVDEIFLCSYLYCLVLYWKIQKAELQGILHLFETTKQLKRENIDDISKRLSRCIALDKIIIDGGNIIRSALVHNEKPDIHFRFSSANTHQSSLFVSVATLTEKVSEILQKSRFDEKENIPALLFRKIHDAMQMHNDFFSTMQRDFTDVCWRVYSLSVAKIVSFQDVVPSEKIESFSELILTKHHPSAIKEKYRSNDELTFVVAHQAFEVWFPSFITAINQAIKNLRSKKPDTISAAYLICQCSSLFQMFWKMIEVPETMTASDYIRFRAELRGGSGAESIQFRAIEMLLGLRDQKYKDTIEHMRIVTPQLQKLWNQPSLSSSLMKLIEKRGIFSTKDSQEIRAKKIAKKIIRPIGVTNPHADLLELTEAAVDLEQKRELWQRHHIAMVERMIGSKPSVGVGGTQIKGKIPKDIQGAHSMPYLQKTLTYQRIFPDLWNARNYLQENWKVSPVKWK